MKPVSNYWILVKLDGRGKIAVEEIATAKTFIQEQFPDLSSETSFSDAQIQLRLWDLVRSEQASDSLLAEACLRCFISSGVQQVCIDLERRFGNNHGFNRYDLFPYVLDDTLSHLLRPNFSDNSTNYTPTAIKVLQTFNPQRANLATWTSRLVMCDQELNAFLASRGVYLVSDWAILNDTSTKQLQRILKTFHHLSSQAIEEAIDLLESYHVIYRQERLVSRKKGIQGRKCQPPSLEQLQRIAALFDSNLPPEKILERLQNLADYLRQYRIYIRGGYTREESLDNPETLPRVEQQLALESDLGEESSQEEFLQNYRQQIRACLEQAIAQTLQKWTTRLKAAKKQQFLTGLELFHCQGYSMTEIAPSVGLQAQFQVTRLLKLKDFRADIRHQMIRDLRDRILELAASYNSPDQLELKEQEIETVLDEEVSTVIQEAESEASRAKNSPLKSLFARTLCRYLHLQTYHEQSNRLNT